MKKSFTYYAILAGVAMGKEPSRLERNVITKFLRGGSTLAG